MTPYERSAEAFARAATLQEIAAMLDWDAAAMMPPGGAAARADQLATLAGLIHGVLTAPELRADLDAADPGPDPWAQANLGLMRRAQARASACPAALVEELARTSAECEQSWRHARQHSDFAVVQPLLERLVALKREEAAALAVRLGLSPYDALLDGYQAGMKIAAIEPLFARIETFLRDAIPRAEARQRQRPAPIRLTGDFPVGAQEVLARRLAALAGLDFAGARLDRSLHPFCGGTPTDLRITTRYDEHDPAQAIMSVLHETGHALYERNLPRRWARSKVGEAAGMAVHESQSLIIEMQACRTDAYLGWLSAELVSTFGIEGPAGTPANLARLWRRVERSLIRTDADELTYPAHVIIRTRIERALLEGGMRAGDIPEAWNEAYRDLLGIVPPNDRQGCLQDIHWYNGLFGYFPSYTLGAIAAAQLMAAARRDLPELDRALARGDLTPLTAWLARAVHAEASRYDVDTLLQRATGRPLDVAAFEAHLTSRYLQ